MRFIRDPSIGERVSRCNLEVECVVTDVLELRIVDQALWDWVRHRLSDIRLANGADEPDRDRLWERRRAIHLLTQRCIAGRAAG